MKPDSASSVSLCNSHTFIETYNLYRVLEHIQMIEMFSKRSGFEPRVHRTDSSVMT
jgi:hypothetical protein